MFETLFSNHWRKPRAKPVQPKSHSYRSMQQNLRAPKFFDEFSEGESTYDEARKPMMLRGNGAPKHPPPMPRGNSQEIAGLVFRDP